MKAIIRIDVPEFQIGQEVSVYFKDTMMVNGICENDWIPIKTRPMTDEEKEYYSEYTICDCDIIYNCPLPEDGQEVLVTDKYGNVEVDTFCIDEGCYFENNCDVDDVIAWMPLPTRYIV